MRQQHGEIENLSLVSNTALMSSNGRMAPSFTTSGVTGTLEKNGAPARPKPTGMASALSKLMKSMMLVLPRMIWGMWYSSRPSTSALWEYMTPLSVWLRYEPAHLGDALAQPLALLERAPALGGKLVGREPLAHGHLGQRDGLVLGELIHDPVEAGVVERVADAKAIGVDKRPGLDVGGRDHQCRPRRYSRFVHRCRACVDG